MKPAMGEYVYVTVSWTIVDRIHSKGNKFVMGVKVSATVNLKLMTALTCNKDCCIMKKFCCQIHQFTSLFIYFNYIKWFH